MKKQLLIFSVLVIIVSIFVSCSANSSGGDISTTAVTDSKGTTHYYEPVTDDKGNVSTTEKKQGVFAEIETNSNGKAVTKKNGTYVTNEHTTVLPIESTTNSTTTSTTQKSTSDTTKDIDNADNEVEFVPDETTAKTTQTITTTTEKETTNTTSTTKAATTTTTTTKTTTKKETQPATDKDGWITKWY